MTTIPRRKIYEVLLDYEDVMIEFQIILFSEKNFKEFAGKFNEEKKIQKLNDKYKEIKALLLLFLKNKKYGDEKEFETELNEILNTPNLTQIIEDKKKFSLAFISLLKKIDDKGLTITEIDSLEHGKKMFNLYDEFNNMIPKILEKRREIIQI